MEDNVQSSRISVRAAQPLVAMKKAFPQEGARLLSVLLSLAPSTLVTAQSPAPADAGRTVEIRYHNDEQAEYLAQVLASMGIEFERTGFANDLGIRWTAADEQTEMEAQNRVSQYFFLKDVCRVELLPPPSAAAVPELQCPQ